MRTEAEAPDLSIREPVLGFVPLGLGVVLGALCVRVS